ncbi:60S ribosomal protein L43 [Mucor velutinosus]|uniref:60S ribosomal protein L43 n=1 Tax=Mucor velutinosus TaxID=708070 RepID=A0AAN7DAE7_9FUNG|nr:60S ribosomal protein L43 [Mucor velutinosus]
MNKEYNFDSETVPVMIQSYMDWEETAAVNAAQKEAKRKTKPHSNEPSLDVVKKERGSYITKNEAKVVNLTNLLQEFENMSISEAGRKVGLSKSTAIRKVKQWNQMTSEIAEKGFPDSIAIKEGKGRPTILKDEHTTVFIFELLANEPTLTVEAVTDHLSKEFRDIQITPPPRSVENHIKKKCRLTYKRISFLDIMAGTRMKLLPKDEMR